jgi:hypothetical protein
MTKEAKETLKVVLIGFLFFALEIALIWALTPLMAKI